MHPPRFLNPKALGLARWWSQSESLPGGPCVCSLLLLSALRGQRGTSAALTLIRYPAFLKRQSRSARGTDVERRVHTQAAPASATARTTPYLRPSHRRKFDMISLPVLHFNDVYRVQPFKLSSHSPETIDVTQWAAMAEDIYNSWPERADGRREGLFLFSGDVFAPSTESSVTRGSHMVRAKCHDVPDRLLMLPVQHRYQS